MCEYDIVDIHPVIDGHPVVRIEKTHSKNKIMKWFLNHIGHHGKKNQVQTSNSNKPDPIVSKTIESQIVSNQSNMKDKHMSITFPITSMYDKNVDKSQKYNTMRKFRNNNDKKHTRSSSFSNEHNYMETIIPTIYPPLVSKPKET